MFRAVRPAPVAHVHELGAAGLIRLFHHPGMTAHMRFALLKADAGASSTVGESGTMTGGNICRALSTLLGRSAAANGAHAAAPSAQV